MTIIHDTPGDPVTCPRCGAKNRTAVITVDALEQLLLKGVGDRMNLQMKHYAVLAAFLVSLGPQLGGLQHGWHDALTPTFIGGLVAQIGTIIAAVTVGSPFSRDANARTQTAGPTLQGTKAAQ